MYANPNNYIPQNVSIRRPLLMWLTITAGSLAVMSLIIGAPLALKADHPFWGLTIYRAFSYVCHQIPERSFFVEGHPFAVCARCTGLYAGFTIATIAYPLVRSLKQTTAPPRKWLFMAAGPLAVDFTVGFLGIWDNTHFSRFATGALLGSVAVFYVMPGFMDLSLRSWGRKDHSRVTANNRAPVEMLSAAASASPVAPSDYSAPHRRI